MSQSNYIFGCLVIAFIVYVTAKGEFSVYLSFLTASGKTGSSSTTVSQPVKGFWNNLFSIGTVGTGALQISPLVAPSTSGGGSSFWDNLGTIGGG